MSNPYLARQLISQSFTLLQNTTYKIKGEPTRFVLVIQFDPTGSSSGFDVAFVRRGTAIAEENYVDGVGKEITRIEVRDGCSNDIYIRDTNNNSDEVVYFVSDVPIDMEEVS